MERERIQDVIENISRRLHNGLHNKKKEYRTLVLYREVWYTIISRKNRKN